MVLIPASATHESGAQPSKSTLVEMQKFNQDLLKAGVLIAGDWLLPSSKGVRVTFEHGTKTVVSGPFHAPLIAGYWIWQVRSRDEAIEWLKRAPFGKDEAGLPVSVELRECQ